MSGKRKPVLQNRSVEDDSLVEEDIDGHVVAVVVSPYDNVSSPDSTASGPTYAPRQPGFEHHAHQDIEHRKNKRNNVETKAKKSLDTPVLVKHRPKRDPLPMKLRALPQSFWQQPNQPTNVSPGAVYPVLPPLSVPRDNASCTRETPEETSHEPLLLSPANTELLFSLFRGVESDSETSRPPVVRRGRPRKAPSTLMARVLKDDDPCLGSAAGHAALPMLMSSSNASKQQQMMSMMPSFRDCERSSLILPSLSGVDQSYSQILSELVIRL